MFAGLAGGMGVRLAFTSPLDADKTRPRAAAGGAAPGGGARTAPAAAPGSVPAPASRASSLSAESAILEAHSGMRLRLLMAWLPGAGEEELRRMAERFIALGPDNHFTADSLSLRLLMVRWAEVDPRGMLEWSCAARLPGQNYVHNAITAWARVDFESAWAAASDELPDMRIAALLGLTATDPDKCLRFLRTDPALLNLSRQGNIFEVLQRINERDPAGVAALLDKGTVANRISYAGQVALAWVKSDPAAAVAWMTGLEPSVRSVVSKNAGEWLAVHAPEQLPALVASLPAGPLRTGLEAAGFATLAATDAAAARHQLEAMPASPARQFRRGLLLEALFRQGDEAGALALASQLGWTINPGWVPVIRQQAYGENFDHIGLTRTGFAETPILQSMRELLGRVAARAPQQAAVILAENPAAAAALLTGDKESNPAALAGVLLADAPGSRENLKTLTDNWATRDPAAAASWSVAHDQPMHRIMERWIFGPAGALAWAATLPPEKRLPLLLETVPFWGPNKRVDVPTAIRQSPLPAAEKERLLQEVSLP